MVNSLLMVVSNTRNQSCSLDELFQRAKVLRLPQNMINCLPLEPEGIASIDSERSKRIQDWEKLCRQVWAFKALNIKKKIPYGRIGFPQGSKEL